MPYFIANFHPQKRRGGGGKTGAEAKIKINFCLPSHQLHGSLSLEIARKAKEEKETLFAHKNAEGVSTSSSARLQKGKKGKDHVDRGSAWSDLDRRLPVQSNWRGNFVKID